jgi:uncharacterized protein (TIGR02421 family)
MQVEEREKARIRAASRLIHEAAQPVRVLPSLAWAPEVKERFYAGGERSLPEPTYPAFDPTPSIEKLVEVRRMLAPVTVIDMWLERQAASVEAGARMLATMGTSGFFEHSRSIYGEPTDSMRYVPATSLDLAHKIYEVIDEIAKVEVNVAPLAYYDAEDVAKVLQAGVRNAFDGEAPKIEIMDALSANALASPERICVRRGARFTDRDAEQLLQHEAYIHVATAFNGRAQTDLPSLGDSHPGTDRTQEGLAVLAELMSGTLELDRMRRLADRVIAIQQAIEGADFLDAYRWFLDRLGDRDQAFESARRVFRGGVLSGGAPFTKDVVYLFGLLQTSNALRATFMAGRADCIPLLFVGKLDVFDIPAIAELTAMGLCRPPRYLPPWAADPRFLMALLCYSTFTSGFDERPLREAATRMLAMAPIVRAMPHKLDSPAPPPRPMTAPSDVRAQR